MYVQFKLKCTVWAVEMMDYYEIGQRIRRIRKARGLSQEQLAAMIGISTTHMSHIETANTKLSLQVFADIAAALSVQADVLLHDHQQETVTGTAAEMVALLETCDVRQARTIAEIAKSAKQALDAHGEEALGNRQ